MRSVSFSRRQEEERMDSLKKEESSNLFVQIGMIAMLLLTIITFGYLIASAGPRDPPKPAEPQEAIPELPEFLNEASSKPAQETGQEKPLELSEFLKKHSAEASVKPAQEPLETVPKLPEEHSAEESAEKLHSDQKILEEETKGTLPTLKKHFARFGKQFHPVNIACAIPKFSKYAWAWIKNPCWQTLSDNFGAEEVHERHERLRPAGLDHRIHKTGVWYHVMGASCLGFAVPTIVAAYMLYTEAESKCVALAVSLCAFLSYVAVISFAADYWYHDDSCEPGEVPEYRKQWISNVVDRINVPIIVFSLIGLICVQTLYSPGMNYAYPCVLGTFAVAVCCQQLSTKNRKAYKTIAMDPSYKGEEDPRYDEAKCYIWWGTFYHTVWHIISVLCGSVQIYGLMKYGINLPCF